MSNTPELTSPSPVAKVPGSSKRIMTTQATPVNRPPQPNPNSGLEASGQDGMGNTNHNHNPHHTQHSMLYTGPWGGSSCPNIIIGSRYS